jgi:sialate O-acetylesterase
MNTPFRLNPAVHFTALSFLCLTLGSSLQAEVKLAGMFGDNMMLQRDGNAPVWGTADPGDTITLTLQDQKITATAGADGTWKTAFKGLKPGVSLSLTVAGKGNTVTVNNVAIGDIWVCSGQSNMDYHVGANSGIYKDEIAAANYPDIRYFFVPNVASLDPVNDVKAPWQICTPETAGGFTAVGFFFARHIHSEIGVPIGLIRCSWSGMSIEPFIPLDVLESVPGPKEKADDAVAKLKSLQSDADKFTADDKAWLEKYGRVDTDNKGFAAKWADPALDTRDWIPTTTPGDWTKVGAPNGGIIWLRKTVQLPAKATGFDLNLTPGVIHDTDTAYFNGVEVGTGGATPPYFWNDFRKYHVPKALIKEGDNVIAFRIVSQHQRNYSLAPAGKLSLPVADPKALTDEWLAKVETEYPALPANALAELPTPPTAVTERTPSTIYNGMIHPITAYGIKGALWYQGESSAGEAWAYRTYLPLLITGWRQKWNQGDFPFYFVQLPNLGIAPKTPGEGDVRWAEMREAELMTWQKVPNTGMAITLDVGDANNLHPPDKKDVGDRLALQALANTYGRKIEASGPIYESMTVEGSKIRLKFTHLGGGLVARGGPLKQFSICGVDKKWAWGDAVIDGDTVVVSSADVPTPVAVRYAWANEPEGCNLYNKAGLPASTFRTDTWPLTSENHW